MYGRLKRKPSSTTVPLDWGFEDDAEEWVDVRLGVTFYSYGDGGDIEIESSSRELTPQEIFDITKPSPRYGPQNGGKWYWDIIGRADEEAGNARESAYESYGEARREEDWYAEIDREREEARCG